jgi:hypothetical protein
VPLYTWRYNFFYYFLRFVNILKDNLSKSKCFPLCNRTTLKKIQNARPGFVCWCCYDAQRWCAQATINTLKNVRGRMSVLNLGFLTVWRNKLSKTCNKTWDASFDFLGGCNKWIFLLHSVYCNKNSCLKHKNGEIMKNDFHENYEWLKSVPGRTPHS